MSNEIKTNNSLFNLPVEKYWDFTKKYTEEKKRQEIQNRIASYNYISSEKRDGHYSRLVKNFDGEIRLESRTISTITGEYANKIHHVPHIAKSFQNLPKGTILIGELCFDDRHTSSQDVGKILGCLAEKAVKRQGADYPFLHYYIHDCWYDNGESLMDSPYIDRINHVQKIYDNFLRENPYIECAHWQSDPKNIKEQMENVFSIDGEGIVLVDKHSRVDPGKRVSWKTIKVKKELEHHIDCFFTGNYRLPNRVYTGKDIITWTFWEDLKTGKKLQGNYFDEYESGATIEPVTSSYFHNLPGSLEIGLLKEGKAIPIGFLSGLTEEMKKNFEKYTDCPCEVTCMQFTNDGNLRHAKLVQMRPDLSKEDCTWEKVWGN